MKHRIWIRRKDRVKQRYWVGRKQFHARVYERKWDDRYPEVDLICPECGTKNWAGVGRMGGRGTIAQCGTCGYVNKAEKFVRSRIKQLESKNYGMGFTKMMQIKTPKTVTFYGIDELQKGEERGPASDFDYQVESIKRDADTLATYKDTALGKIKRSDEPFWKGRYSKEELEKMDKENQEQAMKKYQESVRIKGLKHIQPVGIIRLSRGEISHGAIHEKGAKDWEKELGDTMDVPFTKKIVQLAGHKPEDVIIKDVTKEFKGLTPDQAYKKAFPPIEIVSPEDPFIELTPAIYNKKGKKGDFKIRGEGPVGTIEEIKKQFPGKKIKINWGRATEEID